MLAKAISGYSLQPVINIATGETIYKEMLVRFSDGRNVQDAIVHAELDRTVHLIDKAVLSAAVELIEQDGGASRIAINISPVTIDVCGQDIIAVLRDLGPLSRSLVLEITETAPVLLPDTFREFVLAAHALGTQIAVDDFGSGFCDTARVMIVRAAFIKVPKGGPYGWAKLHLVHLNALKRLAETHNATIIAEGVETSGDLLDIQQLGITGAQGYYFGKPRPATSAPPPLPPPAEARRTVNLVAHG